jgi:hypothetical protein
LASSAVLLTNADLQCVAGSGDLSGFVHALFAEYCGVLRDTTNDIKRVEAFALGSKRSESNSRARGEPIAYTFSARPDGTVGSAAHS